MVRMVLYVHQPSSFQPVWLRKETLLLAVKFFETRLMLVTTAISLSIIQGDSKSNDFRSKTQKLVDHKGDPPISESWIKNIQSD